MVKILVCYSLKPEQNQTEYEKWLTEVHHPRMKKIPGAVDSKTLKVNSVMQGTFPYQYQAEVVMENEMSVMLAASSGQMQEMMKEWTPKVANFNIVITKEV